MYYYCFWFDRGVVYVVVILSNINCLRFDRGVVHVVLVILPTITVQGFTEEWFMFCLLYSLPSLFTVLQRSGSCCCWYIVYHYCLRFDWGVADVVVILYTITVYGLTEDWFMLLLLYYIPFLFKVWQRNGSSFGCHIVYHYCLRFYRGVVHVVVVILSNITFLGLTEEWFMFCLLYCLPLLFKVWERRGSCCCCYIIYHYCLRFHRGMVHVLFII
jgi:hypothetical protein